MKIIIEKGDSKELMMMAEAMLANKMVSSIERADYEINVVHKRDDEIAVAVIEVTKLFGVGAQWTAGMAATIRLSRNRWRLTAFYARTSRRGRSIVLRRVTGYFQGRCLSQKNC